MTFTHAKVRLFILRQIKHRASPHLPHAPHHSAREVPEPEGFQSSQQLALIPTGRDMDHLTTSIDAPLNGHRTAENAVRVSEREMLALNVLAGFYSDDGLGYVNFKTIAKRSGLDPKHVRRTVRALARKGLAEYARGLWSEDGEPRGSGYCCTKLGHETASNPAVDDYYY